MRVRTFIMKKFISYIRSGIGNNSDLEKIEQNHVFRLHDFILLFCIVFIVVIFSDKNYGEGFFLKLFVDSMGINFTMQQTVPIELKIAFLSLFVMIFFIAHVFFGIYIAFNSRVAFFIDIKSALKFVASLSIGIPVAFVGIWLKTSILGLFPYPLFALALQIIWLVKALSYYAVWVFRVLLNFSYIKSA